VVKRKVVLLQRREAALSPAAQTFRDLIGQARFEV
jgi:hypothetical protein